jgi:hypothetical protein
MSVTRGKIHDHLANPSAYTVEAIANTIARLDFEAAAARLFARAASGLEVPRGAVAATIPHLRDPLVVTELIRQCDGDRVEMLVELLERMVFPTDEIGVHLIALVLGAMVKLGLGAHRPRAVIQARLLVVQFFHDRRAMQVFPAIVALESMFGDAYLSAMVAPLRAQIPRHEVVELPHDLLVLWARFDRPKNPQTVLDDLFPALPVVNVPPRSTAELFRLFRNTSRNQPCPCGSGKKLKQCHGPQLEREMSHDVRLNPPPVPAVVGGVSLHELAARGPTRLEDAALLAAIDRLVDASLWQGAETFLAELDTRVLLPQDERDLCRYKVVLRAFVGQRFDVVKRQMPAVRSEEITRMIDPGMVSIAVEERAPDALDQLLRCAERAVRDSTGAAAFDFASAISHIAPALGLLLWRGCMYLPQAYQGRHALSSVDVASARVGVIVGDSVQREPALILAQAMQAAATKRAEDTERSRLQGVVDHLRAELAGSEKRAKALERQLEDVRAELRARPAPVAVPPAEPAELRRLRDKIDELQDMVRERNQELAALRREVETLRRARA